MWPGCFEAQHLANISWSTILWRLKEFHSPVFRNFVWRKLRLRPKMIAPGIHLVEGSRADWLSEHRVREYHFHETRLQLPFLGPLMSRKSLQMENVAAECSELTIGNKNDSFGMAQVDLMPFCFFGIQQWQHECRKASGFQRICKTEEGRV